MPIIKSDIQTGEQHPWLMHPGYVGRITGATLFRLSYFKYDMTFRALLDRSIKLLETDRPSRPI
jgi:hypothetical protein